MQHKRRLTLNKEFRELEESEELIHRLDKQISKERTSDGEMLSELRNLDHEVNLLSSNLGVEIQRSSPKQDVAPDAEMESIFLSNPMLLEAAVDRDFLSTANMKTELNTVDWFVVGFSAAIATLLDFLVVKTPKNPLGSSYPKDPSAVTGWLRNIGVDSKGDTTGVFKWLEEHCKVPFDMTAIKEIPEMNPRTHRLFSLGHDPLLGIIFGLHDILRGGGTFIGPNGNLVFVKHLIDDNTSMILAPLVWLGHMISDVVTRAGLPIPGWGLTQLLNIGDFGNKGRSVADISRWMYLNGYDLRHMVTMSAVPASIEMLVRGYFLLNEVCSADIDGSTNLFSNRLNDEMKQLQRSIKLHKMLFYAHLGATSGNALRVAINQGNPLTINIAEWIAMVKSSHRMFCIATRDKTPEMILRNRDTINQTWSKILQTSLKKRELPAPPVGLYSAMYIDLKHE